MKTILQFFRDAVTEFRHVTWPTREQLQKHTALVIGFVAVFALFVAGLDAAFSYGFSLATQNVKPATMATPARSTATDASSRESTTGEAKTPVTLPAGSVKAIDANGQPVEGVTVTPVEDSAKK